MGYIIHHSISVVGSSEEIIKAHSKLLAMLPYPSPVWVSDVSPLMVNGTRSFFVAPDGSKEGWDESNAGDTARELIVNFLRSHADEHGATMLSWVEVAFGGDLDYESPGAQIVDSSSHVFRRIQDARKMDKMKRAEVVVEDPEAAWKGKSDRERLSDMLGAAEAKRLCP